jgi:hypothetical protein
MRSLLVIAAACGGAAAPPQTPNGPPASTIAAPASPDDAIVATVSGRPIYGSCVAAQAAAHRLDAHAALDQCIAFELLAAEAERRGFARDPAVVDATRVALASAVVVRGYERAFTKQADFGDAWDEIVKNPGFQKNIVFRLKHLEYRASTYVRVVVPKGAPKSDDDAAHALADRIAGAAAPETGLLGPHLVAIAARAVPERRLVPTPTSGTQEPTGAIEWENVPPYRNGGRGGLEDEYADALFAIRELGRASPAVRTSRGWDVIAWTAVEPELAPSPDVLAAALMPEVQRAYFARWVGKLGRSMGVQVQLFEDNVKLLDASGKP